jgi:hypothetical protein
LRNYPITFDPTNTLREGVHNRKRKELIVLRRFPTRNSKVVISVFCMLSVLTVMNI